jgi:energy-converting hydrogenase B subunit D
MIGNILHVVVLVLIVVGGALAAASLLVSLEFYILQAPDVAIAEAGIGAALTTAIYVIALRRTRRKEEEE